MDKREFVGVQGLKIFFLYIHARVSDNETIIVLPVKSKQR